MPPPECIRFDDRRTALLARATAPEDLADALARLGFAPPRPVLVLVGAANGLEAGPTPHLAGLFRDQVAALCTRLGALVIDGGTDAGVMALMGRARAATGSAFPLLGIAAAGTVRLPGESQDAASGRAALEPNHSHFLLVPGERWGDEASWISRAATVLAGSAGSATLVAGGGRVTAIDVEQSLRDGRRTLVLAGSGGTADRIAAKADTGAAADLLRPIELSAASGVLPALLRGCLDGSGTDARDVQAQRPHPVPSRS